MAGPTISIVVPAYNEEQILPRTLPCVRAAMETYAASGLGTAELIVVDNASTDSTTHVAERHGARIVPEPRRGIGQARNAGAREAAGRWLLFLDADTTVPEDLLTVTHRTLSRPGCVGGAVSTDYRPQRTILLWYTRFWGLVAKLRRMAQGIAQFCTAEAFELVGGYRTDLRMAEDTEFYWRLQDLAKGMRGHVTYVTETAVVPSSRRLDAWPIWKTLVMTNPLTTRLFLRSGRFWRGWYDDTVR
jgi:GT2 family glycosyltransferase